MRILKYLHSNVLLVVAIFVIVWLAVDAPRRDRLRLFEIREQQIEQLLQAIEEDHALAEQQLRQLEDLRQLSESLIDALEDPEAQCLGPADTDRLRQLWNKAP